MVRDTMTALQTENSAAADARCLEQATELAAFTVCLADIVSRTTHTCQRRY